MKDLFEPGELLVAASTATFSIWTDPLHGVPMAYVDRGDVFIVLERPPVCENGARMRVLGSAGAGWAIEAWFSRLHEEDER